MSSAVDICNLALSHLADQAEVSAIDPPDGSVQADHCARFYPIARDELLERHAWSFATRRAVLAELTPEVDNWAYAYALPTGCIRPLAVLLPESTDDLNGQPFDVETLEDGSGVIYTNVEDAVLKFIWRQEDTSRFSPLFTVALGRLLAYYVAGPLTRDPKRAEEQLKVYEEIAFPRAAAADAAGRHNNAYGDNHTPGHIAARS